MLKSFLYAVLKVYIYIRSDWYEPVTFLYIESRISYYTRMPRHSCIIFFCIHLKILVR